MNEHQEAAMEAGGRAYCEGGGVDDVVLAVLAAIPTESTLRAQIAAEIEALKFNPGGIRLFIQMGGTVAWTEGWDGALTTAAETIRGDLTPTPDRKDAS